MLNRLCVSAALCVLALYATAGFAQQLKQMPKDADPAFEVASIKPTPENDCNQGFHQHGRHVQVENETVNSLIMFAYAIHAKQIVDAPVWFATDRYDIDGVADVEGEPNLRQYQGMIRKLLEERFHLKYHREKRELSVFAIRQAKGGAKLAKSTHAPDDMPDQTGNGTTMHFTNNSMSDFALGMQFFQDRPVVDETGLDGRYDFKLSWTPESRLQTADANAPPGMFTAIQEQLGLKLEAAKAPVEVLVVERVERPGEN